MTLKVRNLKKSFDAKDVLCGVDFELTDGIYLLTGASGSRKPRFFVFSADLRQRTAEISLN